MHIICTYYCTYLHIMSCSFAIVNIMFMFVSLLALGVLENACKPYGCNFESQLHIILFIISLYSFS